MTGRHLIIFDGHTSQVAMFCHANDVFNGYFMIKILIIWPQDQDIDHLTWECCALTPPNLKTTILHAHHIQV